MHVKLMTIVDRLLAEGRVVTKREVYYQHEGFFRSQSEVDSSLDRLARTLRVPRDALGIVAGSKGLVFGSGVKLNDETGSLSEPRNVPLEISKMKVEAQCKFVLVLEKEAVFNCILADYEHLSGVLGEFVLVTGKGYPCMATRQLVSMLSAKIPVFVMVDYDPYGLDIALQYRIGSVVLPHEAARLSSPSLKYLGVTFRDIDCYGSATSHFEQLTERERALLAGVRRRAAEAGWAEVEKEATKMLDKGVKAEIEAIRQDGSYFTRNFLPEKLNRI